MITQVEITLHEGDSKMLLATWRDYVDQVVFILWHHSSCVAGTLAEVEVVKCSKGVKTISYEDLNGFHDLKKLKNSLRYLRESYGAGRITLSKISSF